MSSTFLRPLGSCPFRLEKGCLTCAIKTRAGFDPPFSNWSAGPTFSDPVPQDMRYPLRTVSQTAANLSGVPFCARSRNKILVPSLTFDAVVEFGKNSNDAVFCMFSIHALRCLSCADPSGSNVESSYRSK